jgi:hypothetical protein
MSRYPESDNNDATAVFLLHEGIGFGSSYRMVELGGGVVCFYNIEVGESRQRGAVGSH